MINVLKLKASERNAIKRVAESRGFASNTVRIKRDGTVWAQRMTALGPNGCASFVGYDLHLVRDGLQMAEG